MMTMGKNSYIAVNSLSGLVEGKAANSEDFKTLSADTLYYLRTGIKKDLKESEGDSEKR